ncbi:MAG: thioesterase family protein [Ignavibacteriaceae bacterium]
MFAVKKRINFYDCDPAGILFFARVYEICHSAYEEMIRSFNLGEDYWTNENYLVPILKSEASYHKPIKFGEMITVEIVVGNLRDSSFELNYEVKNDKREVCTKVKTAHIFVDKKSWKKTEIVEEVKEELQNHQ